MSKYGDLINEARKPEKKKSIEPDDQFVDLLVNLCVKIPRNLRRHWMSEAKKEGVTVTALILEMLEKRYGKPDNQQTK